MLTFENLCDCALLLAQYKDGINSMISLVGMDYWCPSYYILPRHFIDQSETITIEKNFISSFIYFFLKRSCIGSLSGSKHWAILGITLDKKIEIVIWLKKNWKLSINIARIIALWPMFCIFLHVLSIPLYRRMRIVLLTAV